MDASCGCLLFLRETRAEMMCSKGSSRLRCARPLQLSLALQHPLPRNGTRQEGHVGTRRATAVGVAPMKHSRIVCSALGWGADRPFHQAKTRLRYSMLFVAMTSAASSNLNTSTEAYPV